MARDRIDVVVGRKLNWRRSALGITLQELARELNISAECLTAFEEGSLRIPPRVLLEISDALRVRPLYFFCEDGDLGDPAGEARMGSAATELEQGLILSEELSRIPDPALRSWVVSLTAEVARLRRLFP